MKAKGRILILILAGMISITLASQAKSKSIDAVPLPGGTVLPNKTFTINLENSLVLNRWYNITCDIENPNPYSDDPVVLRLTGGWSRFDDHVSGTVGKITVNQNQLVHSQFIIKQQFNHYLATDVMISNFNPNNPATIHLELRFENFHTTDSVTVKNCYANYMGKLKRK